jgi:hypothetical protein
MWSTIIGLLSSIIGGAVSSGADEGYEEALQGQIDKQKTAPALSQAESIYRALANTGLPGYETAKQEIDTSVPTTLNQFRESVQSGSMVDALTSIYTKSQGAQRELNRANDAALIGNKRAYGEFLSGPMAGAQERSQNTITSLEMAKANEEKQRAVDKLSFSQAGVGMLGNSIEGFMGMKGLDSWIAGLFGQNQQSGSSTANQTATSPTGEAFGEGFWAKDDPYAQFYNSIFNK